MHIVQEEFSYNFTFKLQKVMGYIPTIILSKEDIDKHSEYIEYEYQWKDRSDDEKAVLKHLQENLRLYNKHSPVVLKGVSMMIIKPEFTTFNQNVRDMLDELEIDYTVDI